MEKSHSPPCSPLAKPCCIDVSGIKPLVTMIIACPACSTRYVVPDTAVGVDGRTVRCAKCRHSWFQQGPEIAVPAERPSVQDDAQVGAQMVQPAPEPQPVRQPAPEPAPEPQPERVADEPVAVAEAVAGPPIEPPPPVYDELPEPAPSVIEHVRGPSPRGYDDSDDDDDASPFNAEPPFRPRRNLLRVWTMAGVAFALLATGTVVAASYWGLPDWVPVSRPTFAAGNRDLVLDFPADQQDRRTLPNQTEFFGASGTITNTGRETLPIPSILIVMRDARERIVYSWEVAPPEPTLAPGEVMRIDEAVTDVPKSAKYAEFGWKPT